MALSKYDEAVWVAIEAEVEAKEKQQEEERKLRTSKHLRATNERIERTEAAWNTPGAKLFLRLLGVVFCFLAVAYYIIYIGVMAFFYLVIITAIQKAINK